MQTDTFQDLNIAQGSDHASILVVCDTPNHGVWNKGMVMSVPHMKLFSSIAERAGFRKEDFVFLTPSSPIPEECQGSDSRTNKWMDNSSAAFAEAIEDLTSRLPITCVLSLGKMGGRQTMGRSVAITKARGTFTESPLTGDLPVLPLLSPSHVLARPENRDVFESDFRQLSSLRDCGWVMDSFRQSQEKVGYEWCLNISHLLSRPPKKISVDCETVGLDWHKKGFRVLTISITTAEGNAYVVPLDLDYWNDDSLRGESNANLPKLTRRQINKLRRDVRELLGNAEVSVVGHNLSFDIHALRTLGIEVSQWFADTIQLAFCVDDNMLSKSLSDCTRRWVPALAGYSDLFDSNTDKSKMHEVDHDSMLEYAGGDTDATFRLAKTLLTLAKEDSRNWKAFTHVQMPALRAFVEMEENGVLIDKEELRSLEGRLDTMEKESYAELIAMVDRKVLRRHEGKWSFSRSEFVVDILFSPKRDGGMGLTPLVFTDGTAKLPADQQIPSTSDKKHLSFFDDNLFVQKLIAYKKLTKMKSTYVGQEGKVEVSEVDRLKSGDLPKKVRDHFDKEGLSIPKSKSARRRKALFDSPIITEVSPYLKYRIDRYGNVKQKTKSEPTGFWQYLEGSDRIHPSFLLHSTVTGRTSSRGPNAQNFPKRGELAKMFRKIFVAPEGRVFLEADLSQAELRVAAWMAGESEMIRIYKNNGDIHSSTAAAVISVSEEVFNAGRKDKETKLQDVVHLWKGADSYLRIFTSEEKRASQTVADYCDYKRFQAKAINFGFLYGMGWRGFKNYAKLEYGIDVSDEEAMEMRETFFRKYPGLAEWHKGMELYARDNEYVRALHGPLRRLPSVLSVEDNIQAMAVRQAINSPVQRFGSDLGLIALHRFLRDCPPEIARPALFIHDANIFDVDASIAMQVAANLKHYMQSPPLEEWFDIKAPFPILSDVSMGPNLCDMEELDELEAEIPEWYREGEVAHDPSMEEAWRVKRRRQIILTDD